MPQKSLSILTHALGQRLTIAPNAPLTKWRIIIARLVDIVGVIRSSPYGWTML